MKPLLYPIESAQHLSPSFAWACELSRKIGSDIIVLGSKGEFLLSEVFRLLVEKLSRNYQNRYHPDEGPVAPHCIPVLSDNAVTINLTDYLQENLVSLVVFPHHFSHHSPLFQQLDEQQYPYIQLPSELPHDSIGNSPVENHRPKYRAFYDIYYRAEKNHLTNDFILQLAKDTHLSGFLVDHFRNQPEA